MALSWRDSIALQTSLSSGSGWTGYTLRCLVPASLVTKSAHSKVRVTLPAVASDTSYDAFYIGHGASSGDVYDFETTPVRVTVGGQTSFTVTAGQSLVSDTLTFTLDETKPFLISCHLTTDLVPYKDGVTGVNVYYRNGDHASTVDASSFTGPYETDWLACISRLEADIATAVPMHRKHMGMM